jgi:3-oxoacyl-[acyl-carrier protein] reductase
MSSKKVAFITGGSRGIGLGIAEELAQNGFDLAINGMRSECEIGDTMQKLKAFGTEIIYCQGDISAKDDRNTMLDKIKNHFGQLNLLVNNAGIAPRQRFDILEATEESFDEVISTNLKGTYFLTQAAANWMIQQKTDNEYFIGKIINITSVSATVASVNRGDYCMSKAGLAMATQLFAVRLGEYGIPVYEVRPGIIQTDMTAGVTGKYDALIANGLTIQNRWGQPADVGKAVAAIATGAFGYSTGQVFMVDGGMTIGRL